MFKKYQFKSISKFFQTYLFRVLNEILSSLINTSSVYQ